MLAQFKREERYGHSLLYPANEAANIICGITKTKTLPVHYIKSFNSLGLDIEIVGEKPELFKGK